MDHRHLRPGVEPAFLGNRGIRTRVSGDTRKGDNLYTCSIVALNPDTGKLAWYFQPSPHDVHDWDAVQTPVVVDADFRGQPQKLLLQASRNGYYFVLDRTNGKALFSVPYEEINWSSGVDAKGRPIAKLDKYPSPAGTLVEPGCAGCHELDVAKLQPRNGPVVCQYPPIFQPVLRHVEGKPEGFAGRDLSVWARSYLKAIEYQTGKIRWEHDLGSGDSWSSVLSTAGGLVFTADNHGNMLALDSSRRQDPVACLRGRRRAERADHV